MSIFVSVINSHDLLLFTYFLHEARNENNFKECRSTVLRHSLIISLQLHSTVETEYFIFIFSHQKKGQLMGSWDMISTSDEVNFIYFLCKGLRFSNGSTPVEITLNCEMQ